MRDTGRNIGYVTNTSEYRQYAVHEDFQDTVWGLSDTSAVIAERYNYTDPYGRSNSEDGNAGSLGEYGTQVFHQKRMHGGFVEEESELYDFRNRWMMAVSGSWCSRDPLGAVSSANMFQFVDNNPLALVDVSGLIPNCGGCKLSINKMIYIDWQWIFDDNVYDKKPADSARPPKPPRSGTLVMESNWTDWVRTVLNLYYVEQKCGCCSIDLSGVSIMSCSDGECDPAPGDLVLHPFADGKLAPFGRGGFGKKGKAYDTITWDANGAFTSPDESTSLNSEEIFSHEFMHIIGEPGHGGPGQPRNGLGIREEDLCGYFEYYFGSSDQCEPPNGRCCPGESGPGVAITPSGGSVSSTGGPVQF